MTDASLNTQPAVEPLTPVPAKTNGFILLTLLIPGLFLATVVADPGNLVMWLCLGFSFLIPAACQWIYGHLAEHYFIVHPEENPSYVPQGPIGRLIPDDNVDFVMLKAPKLFSPYARMEYLRSTNARAYRILDLPVLADIAVSQWEQDERRKIGEAASAIASFDDIKVQETGSTLAKWKGKPRSEIVRDMIRHEIRRKKSLGTDEQKARYFDQWFEQKFQEEEGRQ